VPRETKHIHICLDKLQPEIEKFVSESSVKGGWSRTARSSPIVAKQGLRDRGITRDLKWGVPVPLDVLTTKRKGDNKNKCFMSGLMRASATFR